MKRMRFVQLLAGTLATLVFLVGCGASGPVELSTLAKPAREEPYHFTFDATFGCDDFQVAWSGEVSGFVTTFFDRRGNPTSVRIHERFFGRLTNLTTGYTLTDGPDAYIITDDLENETSAVVGLFFMVRGPDGKKVAVDVGKITFSLDGVTISGPHDVFDAENGICTFLDR